MIRPRKRRPVALLLTALTLSSLWLAASKAPAAERLVLLEKYSASWCPHCMSASQALGQLIDDNPPGTFLTFDAFVATDGNYWTDWGVERANFYGLSAYPLAVFDGALAYQGSTDVYNVYQQGIDARAAVPTDVVIDVSAVQLGGDMYDVTTAVSIEPGGAGKTMRMYLAQALDNYGLYDDGETLAHNTIMQTVEDGFDVTLSPGQTQQFSRTMELDATSLSQFGDIRLIAWAQNPPGPEGVEVLNAAESLLAEAHPADFNSDGAVNAADVTLWENQFGTVGLPRQGADGNGDGRVDGGDFLLAQRAFGLLSNSGSAVAAAAAVPEPTALVSAIVGLGIGLQLLGKRTTRRARASRG